MAKRIAFLGPVGTFSEEAALAYDPRGDLEPFPSIPAVALAVASGIAAEGVVPIENSLEGSVTYTLDILIQEDRLFISNELVIPIEHCLLTRPGTRAADIKTVFSHPQALAQCREFLERCFPKAALVASLSTVAAVEDMKKCLDPAGAISPRRAAELHHMEVLAQGIQDNSSNVTRFVILSHSDHPPTGRDKTSLCFSFQGDAPGLLYNVMGEFARRNINLAKVESRPTKRSLGQYIFLVDCEGHREDPPVKEAIDSVRRQTSMLKIFGSYPRWREKAG
jgi:prephenate dehydratase